MEERNLKPRELRGEWKTEGLRFGIVVSDFNRFITDRLLTGALDAMARAGMTEEQIQIIRVPGSFEIPITAKKLAQTGQVDSIVCVGCILRGETSHYDYVASETSRGVQLAQMDTGIPMIFCVLTCDTLEQAIDRAGLKGGNKGYEAGVAAIEMAHISKKLTAAKPALSAVATPTSGNRRARRG
ncbi:MAG TPA: 6,7-dimethyl-8-ribityllumazine synthase [Candidatus Acidoferrales bacterium]|nr:6,7-dimethyl-8-ribityllumazine synthase [Candidatus Acidoferrales bacterium]